jgi:hypothetical protein
MSLTKCVTQIYNLSAFINFLFFSPHPTPQTFFMVGQHVLWVSGFDELFPTTHANANGESEDADTWAQKSSRHIDSFKRSLLPISANTCRPLLQLPPFFERVFVSKGYRVVALFVAILQTLFIFYPWISTTGLGRFLVSVSNSAGLVALMLCSGVLLTAGILCKLERSLLKLIFRSYEFYYVLVHWIVWITCHFILLYKMGVSTSMMLITASGLQLSLFLLFAETILPKPEFTQTRLFVHYATLGCLIYFILFMTKNEFSITAVAKLAQLKEFGFARTAQVFILLCRALFLFRHINSSIPRLRSRWC